MGYINKFNMMDLKNKIKKMIGKKDESNNFKIVTKLYKENKEIFKALREHDEGKKTISTDSIKRDYKNLHSAL